MKNLLKKLLRCLWLVCFGAMPLCAVGEAFTGDNIAEIEAALAREAQTKSRLMAASPKLLSAAGDDNTYWATGELNVSKTRGETISLQFDIPKSYTHIKTATLTINAWDVDTQDGKERDEVYLNGTHLGKLYGGTECWDLNQFSVPVSVINSGINQLHIVADADNNGWWTKIEYAKLVIDGVVDYIRLEASQNYDDRIQLKWNVSSGLSGARYYVERRMNETDPFERINQGNPISGRQFSDTTSLPGVNYYYRVVSENGVESEQDVGKRVAEKEVPKFWFYLEGLERPQHKGSRGEDNVLVAGKTVRCVVFTMNTTQPVLIKRVELVGTPKSQVEGRREHKILWITRSGILDNKRLFGPDNNYFGTFKPIMIPEETKINVAPKWTEFTATLKSGPGLHGEYQWELKCEFSSFPAGIGLGDGTWSAENTFSKPVYFDKYGTDNRKSPGKIWDSNHDNNPQEVDITRKTYGAYVDNVFCQKVPNWYVYWKEDGACPGLSNVDVYYRGKGGNNNNQMYGGEFVQAVEHNYLGEPIQEWTIESLPTCVYIDADAASYNKIIKIENSSWGDENQVFGMITRKENGEENINKYRVFGIYNVEDVVAHEFQHRKTWLRFVERTNPPYNEKDKDNITVSYDVYGNSHATCRISSGTIENCRGDGIVDNDENRNYFGQDFNVDLGIRADEPDTYDLATAKAGVYAGYGDDELVSMFAGRKGMSNAIPGNDWAYPGEQAGGFPDEVFNVEPDKITRAKPLRNNNRALLAASPSDENINTNLVISITGLSSDVLRDQGSVSGLVYTIGIAIQGNEFVEFNGYLIDAQSNVVATAVSAASAESDSVTLFFDSRNIFDNYNGGSLTLGRVDLMIKRNHSSNIIIDTLYDFAVEPIEVDKSELLCNKGYILDGATTNDVSASGIAVSIPVLVNVAGDYRLEAELVSTNDGLVATAFATNYCATGTNVFALTFTSDAIYQNGRSGIQAVKNVQLWCGDEMIDAKATALEFADNYDCEDFVPSGVCIAVDPSSGRFVEPTTTPDGKLSSVRFVFDVTNATGTMIGYDVASVLMNTNFEIAASIRTAVAVTNGLNRIEITIPASSIAKSGVDGPYRFKSIELLPQGEGTCGTTYRPDVLSAAYRASDFGGSAIEPCGTPRLVDIPDGDRLAFEYFYEALRVGRVIVDAVLADRNGDFAARVVTTNEVSEIGVKTNRISIASNDVVGGVTNSPYAVVSLSLTPDIIGESSIYMDTGCLTNIFWPAVTNVRGRQRENSNLVDIYYDLNVADGDSYFVGVQIIGETNAISAFSFTGDVGDGVAPGNDRHVVWDADADWPDEKGNIKIAVTVTKKQDAVQLWEGGPYWATTNIGAEEPWENGYYFWWGDTIGYKCEGDVWVASDGSASGFSFSSTETPTAYKNIDALKSEGWVTSDGVLSPEHDAAQVHLGGEWRMPTDQELSSLANKCDCTSAMIRGVKGCIARGRGDYAANSIFFPAAGSGNGTSLPQIGSRGNYWASVPAEDSSDYRNSWNLLFLVDYDPVMKGASYDRRWKGFPIRPVKDVYTAETETGSSEWFAVRLLTLAAPVFSPATKTVFFRREQTVSISCATDTAEVRYTLDGSEPTASSLLYIGAFVVTNSVTVKAKAFVEGLEPSETVVAEYVHASIVGDNLVQDTAPESGVAQAVSVPVPGTYLVSFGWTQGGNIELRLSKDGDVRTIASVSAESAGTTNLLFDISTAGDYELTVHDLSSGASQPADVSNLSLSIPDTPENKGRYWICETEATYCSTGEWIAESGFKNGKMPIKERNIFTPYTSSVGDHVVMTTTLEFEEPNSAVDWKPDVKAFLTMGMDALSNNVFRVLTMDQGHKVWKDVYAEGMGAPTLGTPYTFKIAFDYANRTYSVALVANETEIPLTGGTTGTFAFASSYGSEIKSVEFAGCSGNIISLFGSYGDSASGFAEGDMLRLFDGAAVLSLTDRQAAWLNSMGAHEAVKAKAGGMGMEDFMVAYLLNLDLTKDGAGLVSFRVSEIEVGETAVTIKVRLDRTGTMQASDGDETRNAPINGILKLYGGDSPHERTLLNATEVTDANFGEGDTATFTYPRNEGTKFFRPVIEVPGK